ncbi:SH3 domain-containing protein [Streptomyces sp. NPDC005925]|uniref:SH3 domain-containing protein n=1 Tax=Streptomyces sp. NPDC005925 TaxID=3157172 RepID=UPI0034045A7E
MSVEHAETAENGPAIPTESTALIEPVEAIESVDSVTTAEATLTATTYYSIAPGYSVNVRSGPGTNYSIVRVLPEGSEIPINCQSPGTWISGPYGTSNIWDNIANGQFVSDAYVQTGSDGYIRPHCG